MFSCLLLLLLAGFLLFLFRQLASLLGRIVLSFELKLGMLHRHHVSTHLSTVQYLQRQVHRLRL